MSRSADVPSRIDRELLRASEVRKVLWPLAAGGGCLLLSLRADTLRPTPNFLIDFATVYINIALFLAMVGVGGVFLITKHVVGRRVLLFIVRVLCGLMVVIVLGRYVR